MADYKSLRVPEDAWEAAKAQKEEHDRTWGQQIVRPDDAEKDTTDVQPVDPDVVAKKVAERLEGSKPLEDMAFEDWFEPDYATTIAAEIIAEMDSETIGSVWAGDLEEQLDRIESAAREATNAAQNAEQAIEEATNP